MDPVPTPLPERRRRRTPLVLALVIALVAAPAIVLAVHDFSDVPDSSPFHDAISQLAGSGVTLGCGSGKFCPKAVVTREQMAAFMTRGLGYAAAGTGAIPMSETPTTYVATVEIPAGTSPGGTVYVAVSGDVSVLDIDAFCPCAAVIGLENVDTGEIAPESLFVVTSETVDGGAANTGSVHWVFEVPSGVTGTFGLYADMFTNTPTIGTTGVSPGPTVYGNIVAEYAPFGSTLTDGAVEKLELPSGWAALRSTQDRKPQE